MRNCRTYSHDVALDSYAASRVRCAGLKPALDPAPERQVPCPIFSLRHICALFDSRSQPGNPRGFITAANNANGRACVLPMKKKLFGGAWVADMPGWGLLDADTRRPIDPVALVTDQKIEMTPWEVQDVAVQAVQDYLQREGFELKSWQGNPEVDPSIWFVGKTKGPEWVVVRSAKFPANSANRPTKWAAIADGCAKLSTTGHFASVAVVSVNQPFESSEEAPVPLWRGHGMHVRFTGLE